MMAMAQNAFANTSSSLVIAKVQGNIVDLLMPPLERRRADPGPGRWAASPAALVVGLAVGRRGAALPAATASTTSVLRAVPCRRRLADAVAASASWRRSGPRSSTRWRRSPTSSSRRCLSSPAPSIPPTRLPAFWQAVAHLNPFFYMIDGFRYGFIGHADGSLAAGLAVLAAPNLLLGSPLGACYATGLQAPALILQVRRFGRSTGSASRPLPARNAASAKDHIDSLLGPALANLLFMLVLRSAAGDQDARADGLPLADFVAPGLLMFAAGERAFSAGLRLDRVRQAGRHDRRYRDGPAQCGRTSGGVCRGRGFQRTRQRAGKCCRALAVCPYGIGRTCRTCLFLHLRHFAAVAAGYPRRTSGFSAGTTTLPCWPISSFPFHISPACSIRPRGCRGSQGG